jgi:murein DD-endopeptidase MepM/ murein hydrolase activator NlpD
MRAFGEALQSMLAQSRSIEGLLNRAQRGQRVVQGYGGYLKWPVSGRISSPYGWRTHPIYGYRSFHTGIDIAAPYGTTVKSARSGEVLYVGVREAYGLIVIIDHGNSLATVYAHLSKAYVRAGQSVRTLSSIGAVGCSGWCTGPHLHFEVRLSGKPVNPMGWL